jgi:hypothetical protein
MLMKGHFKKLRMDVNDISALEEVEKYLVSKCEEMGIELSHDTMAEEPLKFWSLGYGYIAGALVVYPQSTAAYNAYLADAMRKGNLDSDNSEVFSNPVDKYKSKKKCSFKDIDKLVVLPGSNILRSLVDRNQLIALASKDAYAKIHPVTNPEDIKEMKSIFGKRVIGEECGLYEAFNKATNIYTTSSSESAIYAVMNDKNLYSIEEDGHDFKGAYSPLINTLFWSSNRQERKDTFNTLYNSRISNIFHPSGDYKTRIDNFLNSVGKKCQQ